MPLTQEQFTNLRKKGLSTDQIIKFESGQKPAPAPAPIASQPEPQKKSFASKVGDVVTAPFDYATDKLSDTKVFQDAARGFEDGDPDTGVTTEFATDVSKRLFGSDKGSVWDTVFQPLSDRLSETKFIQEAAAGLNAVEAGEVEGSTMTFLGESLLEKTKEASEAFSGRGVASALDNVVAKPLNFFTRTAFGKETEVGKFISDFSGAMYDEHENDTSRQLKEETFSIGKALNPDFYINTVGEALPLTLMYAAMAGKVYGGTSAVGSKVFGTSKWGKIATTVSSSFAGAGVLRGMESSAIAEDVYEQGVGRGMTEEEAIKAGREAFVDSIKLAGLDVAQVFLAFSPVKFGAKSTFGKIVSEGAQLIASGATEAFEEAYQTKVEADALGDEFSWTDPQTLEAAYTGFVLGGAFQLGGKARGNSGQAEEEYTNEVVENLPPEYQEQVKNAADKSDALDQIADTDPQVIEDAVFKLEESKNVATKVAKDASDLVTNLPSQEEISQSIGVKGKSAVALELSAKLPPELAKQIVESAPPARTEVSLPSADELLQTTPDQLQQSLQSLDARFEEETADIRQEIEQLQQTVKDAANNSPEKLQAKKALQEKRNELKTLEQKNSEQGTVAANQTRDGILAVIKDRTDLNTTESQVVLDRVFEKVLKPRLNVPVEAIIDNEVRKYKSPARSTPEQVTEAVTNAVKDEKSRQSVSDEVLDVLQDSELAPVVAELSLDEIVAEVQKKDGLFQVKNASRKPTGKAQFKNIKDDDLLQVAAYIDFVRIGQEAPAQVETNVRRLAERYGINTELTPKQLALAFERLISKNKMDGRVDTLVGEILNQKKELKKAKAKKPKTKAKKPKKVSKELRDQINSIPLFKSIPVTMVDTITSSDGQEAFGRFYRGTVEFVENPDTTTLPHEAFHVYSQMALNSQERQQMYSDAKKAYGRDFETDLEIEETLAQDFAEWFVTEKAPKTFSDRLLGIFQKLKKFMMDLVGKNNRKPIEKIFADVLTEETATKVGKRRRFSGDAFFQQKSYFSEEAPNQDDVNESEANGLEYQNMIDKLGFGSQEDSSVFNELSHKLEEATFEVEAMLEMAEAGYRLINEDGTARAVRSTFPDWVPEHLRSRDLFDKVLQQRAEGREANGSRQQELHDVIRERILSKLPPELLEQQFLNEYYMEQDSVADQLRHEALLILQNLVAEIDANPSVLKKSQVKKTIRTSTGQIRTDTKEFSKKMKERARFFNRGYKTGYREGAREKLAIMLATRKAKKIRTDKITKLKSIYRRVKQATRSGAYLPIDYQKRMEDLFEDFDLTTMTQKTHDKLERMAQYFEAQGGEVPKDVAQKLKRLSKYPVGELSDAHLEELVTEVQRIFEQGVLKKQLTDRKGEQEFGKRVERVVKSVTNDRAERSGVRLGSLDPARVADIIDNGHGRYEGGFYKEVMEPLRVKTDEADIETGALLADALEQIGSFGNSYTEEEMARIMHQSALDQNAPDQADALREHYQDKYDFTKPLNEKERGVLEVMVSTFKEIRGEIAAAYEAQHNKPFPDNPNYFPFKYDKEVEKFDINDASFFDFTPTKTSQGFTMSRQEGVNRVLDIDIFRTFTSEVSKQLYYAKVQPVLSDATNIINASPVQSRLTTKEQNYMKVFIKDIATRGGRLSDNSVIEAASKVSSEIRKNINAAILGYKLSTVMIQPTAIFDAAASVNKRFGTVAAWKVVPNLLRMTFRPSLLAETKARSLALQNRAGGQIELKELRDAQRGQFSPSRWRRAYNAYQKYAFAGIKALDIVTAAAAHDRARTEFIKSGMSEADALLAADQMVALSQSSANIVNRPQFLNNEGAKFFMPFQTFVTNAFNNVTYDLVETEIREHGFGVGTARAVNNLQFILFAVAAEAGLRELYGTLWGYEDEEEERWYEKLFASTLGRIPLSNLFLDFNGDLKDDARPDLPATKSFNEMWDLLVKLADGKDVKNKDVYKAVKGGLVLLGVPGAQQAHQIITAPDIAGLGSIGDDFGLTYDARNNNKKRIDAISEMMEEGSEITAEGIEALAEEVHGKDYTNGDASYKANKRAEMVEYVAFIEQFGAADPFVQVALGKKNNNEVRGFVASNGTTLDEVKNYSRPVKRFGVENKLVASALSKELMAITQTDDETKAQIAQLAAAETDAERIEAINGDKNFAKMAFSRYGLIDKTFYESVR